MSSAAPYLASQTAPTRRVDQLLAHYGESHQHPQNELIHYVAIPVIMLSLIGMLFAIHTYLAYAFIGASGVYYARLSVVFLAAMAVWSLTSIGLLLLMGPYLLPICVGLFVVAWVMQFVGHHIEKKKPSFLEDLQYLWVGPLFVLSKLFVRLGVRW